RGLHLDQRVVGAFERDALGHVLVEKCQPAERMRLGDNAQRLPARYMPEFFGEIFGRLTVKRDALALPRLIVALLRKLAAFAQPIEDFAVAGMGVEPGLGE